MFDAKELKNIGAALVMQQKSVLRLASREGQPESVAAEYRIVGVAIDELIKKVNAELVKVQGKPK